MASTKSLKIGLVLDSSLDLEDGVQQYVMTVGEWLRSRGHDVHYLVGQTENRQLPNIHSLSRNIVVKFNGNRINLPRAARRSEIRELMRHERFDVLHVQTPHHPLLAQRLILAAGESTVVVATFHILPYNWAVLLANKALGVWLRPSLKRVDRMLAVTPAAARFEEETFGLPAEVLPNVFDYPRFHNALPLEKYIGKSGQTIMFLGRLVPRKGCQTLLEAAVILQQQKGVPQFRIVVCGKGPLDAELRQFAHDHRLDEIVEFVGFVSDEEKPNYYAAADLTIFPSNSGESFGIVLLEAMANGKTAVLAGDNPGYRSVMEPQPNLLFEARDAKALAARIAYLLSDKGQRERYAAWGAEYTRQFDVDVVGRKLESLYRNLLDSKKLQ
jgi:phosphatidylinositol alpha-mannosyltransferase